MSLAYSEVARGALDRGFRNSKEWLEGLKMTPVEIGAFFEGTLGTLNSGGCVPGEVPAWMEWIAESGPGETISGDLEGTARIWSEKNPKVAAKWLESAPEGPLKDRISRGYAEATDPPKGPTEHFLPSEGAE